MNKQGKLFFNVSQKDEFMTALMKLKHVTNKIHDEGKQVKASPV